MDMNEALIRHEAQVRPGSSAATNEYGQPGIICAWLFARP
jgi:hypothetical protein